MTRVMALMMLATLAATGSAASRTASAASVNWTVVQLSMSPRTGDVSPGWTVRLRADGAGTYLETGAADTKPLPLTVSQTTLQRLQPGEHAAKTGRCETKAKNIARTGEKTIRYEIADRAAECTFNYSDDPGLMGAAATFQAIADTMQRGKRLQYDLRYDRLGLDADMQSLVEAQKAGSAIEIGNIAPVLQALVQDDHVIDRVRRRAARLLQDAGEPVPAGFDLSER